MTLPVIVKLAYGASNTGSNLTGHGILHTINRVLLHTAFHYNPTILSILLKYC